MAEKNRTRDASVGRSNNYFIHRKRTDLGKKWFSFVGPKVWQIVPNELKLLTFSQFKRKLKFYFISKYTFDQAEISVTLSARMAVRYGTVCLNFCEEVRYAGTVQVRFFVMVRLWYVDTICLSCKGTGTVRWYQ